MRKSFITTILLLGTLLYCHELSLELSLNNILFKDDFIQYSDAVIEEVKNSEYYFWDYYFYLNETVKSRVEYRNIFKNYILVKASLSVALYNKLVYYEDQYIDDLFHSVKEWNQVLLKATTYLGLQITPIKWKWYYRLWFLYGMKYFSDKNRTYYDKINISNLYHELYIKNILKIYTNLLFSEIVLEASPDIFPISGFQVGFYLSVYHTSLGMIEYGTTNKYSDGNEGFFGFFLKYKYQKCYITLNFGDFENSSKVPINIIFEVVL